MQSSFSARRKKPLASTSDEILTAIAIIIILAILFGLLVPVGIGPAENNRKASAKNDELQIVSGIRAFYTEYGAYPVNTGVTTYFGPGPAPADALWGGSTAFLIDVLRSNTGNPATKALVEKLNPRHIVFLDLPIVKSASAPVRGVVPNGSPNAGRWYDPWGSEYNVLVDGGYKNTLPNPYMDAPDGNPLKVGTLTWSFGKNGGPGGGPAISAGFSSEKGSPNVYKDSADVISWW